MLYNIRIWTVQLSSGSSLVASETLTQTMSGHVSEVNMHVCVKEYIMTLFEKPSSVRLLGEIADIFTQNIACVWWEQPFSVPYHVCLSVCLPGILVLEVTRTNDVCWLNILFTYCAFMTYDKSPNRLRDYDFCQFQHRKYYVVRRTYFTTQLYLLLARPNQTLKYVSWISMHTNQSRLSFPRSSGCHGYYVMWPFV